MKRRAFSHVGPEDRGVRHRQLVLILGRFTACKFYSTCLQKGLVWTWVHICPNYTDLSTNGKRCRNGP